MLTLQSFSRYQILYLLVLVLLNGLYSINGEKTDHADIKNLITLNKSQNNLKSHQNI